MANTELTSPHCTRRGVLKATGSVVAVSAASQGATATTDSTSGYGAGGYGEGEYGGTDNEVSVSATTDQASDVQTTAATLVGELIDLGGASSADVGFEYRSAGQSSWTKTESQTLTSPSTFSQSVSGLESETEYEFRAAATASDGDTDTGGIQTFTTASLTTESPPVIDQFKVSEAGKPNPHAEITVAWGVSDADGDLDTVALDISDSDGNTRRSTTWSVEEAGSASDVDEFKIKHGGNTDYKVTISVSDLSGNTVSQTTVSSA